jgi:hypothetical protein
MHDICDAHLSLKAFVLPINGMVCKLIGKPGEIHPAGYHMLVSRDLWVEEFHF